jgi:hypothetical protein
MKKIIFLLAFLFATITNAQTPARHYGGVILGSFASDPTGVSAGQIYWNTTDNKFRAYDGSVWSDLVSGGVALSDVLANGNTSGANDILMENEQKISFNDATAPYDYYIGYEGFEDDKLKIWGEQVDIESVDGAKGVFTDMISLSPEVEITGYVGVNGTYAQFNNSGGAMWTLQDNDLDIQTTIRSDEWGLDNSFWQKRTIGTNTNLHHLIGYSFGSTPFYADLLIGAQTGSIPSNIKFYGNKYTMNGSEFLFDDTVKTTKIEQGLAITQLDTNEDWGYILSAEEGFFFTDGAGAFKTNGSYIFPTGIDVGGSNYVAELRTANLSANQEFQFPDANGTIALTSDLLNVDLQDVLDAGDTWTSSSGFSTLTLASSSSGGLVFQNTDENWGYNIGGEEWRFTDGNGNSSGKTYITTTEISVGNNTNRANLSSTNITTNRDFEFPDASGTLALTSEIPDYSDWLDYSGDTTTGNLSLKFGDFDAQNNGWYMELGQNQRYFGVGDIDDLNNSTIFSINDSLETYTFGGNNNAGAVFDVSAITNVNLTFPSSSGQLALTSDIPDVSEWATSTGTRSGGDLLVTLGDYDNSDIGTKLIIDNTNDYVKIESGNGFFSSQGFNIGTNPLSTFGSLQTNTLTSNRVYDFPDASGTVALTSDIPTSTDYVDLTSAQTISGDKTFADIKIGNNSKLLIEDTGGDFTDYDTSFAVAPVWESGHSDAVKIGKYNKLLVEQNASTQYWNYNDVRLNGNTNATRYEMNWTGSYYKGTGGFSEGTTHSLNQMLIKNTTFGTRDFGFVYNQNNIINVDDFDGGTVTTTVEDFMPLFNQSNINDDNITINDHWINLNQLNYQHGSIGELYGLNVDFNISGSAEVTTSNHLINLEYTNSSSGSVATPYAIYSSSDIPSYHRGDIEIGNASDILLDDNVSGSGASRVEWNSTNYIEYDEQLDAELLIRGSNGIFLKGFVNAVTGLTTSGQDITTVNGNVYVAGGKVHTGSSGGSATIEQDDLKLVRGISGNPQVTGTAGVITHAISFDANGGSNTTLSTPNGYVGQIAVAHEKTPQIEIGSSGGTTNSIDGKDFYYLKWTGGNGNETFNLPDATTNQYRTLQFITNSTVTANTTWTLDGSASQTIDGSTTYVINRAYEGIKLWSDGTEWIIIQAKK